MKTNFLLLLISFSHFCLSQNIGIGTTGPHASAQELGYDFSGVDKPKNENDFYGLRYAEFVVPLVKAVQEQQAQLRHLQNENAELRQRLERIETVFHTSSNQTAKH